MVRNLEPQLSSKTGKEAGSSLQQSQLAAAHSMGLQDSTQGLCVAYTPSLCLTVKPCCLAVPYCTFSCGSCETHSERHHMLTFP